MIIHQLIFNVWYEVVYDGLLNNSFTAIKGECVFVVTADYTHFVRLNDITVVVNITKDMDAVMIEVVRKLPAKKLIPYH